MNISLSIIFNKILSKRYKNNTRWKSLNYACLVLSKVLTSKFDMVKYNIFHKLGYWRGDGYETID